MKQRREVGSGAEPWTVRGGPARGRLRRCRLTAGAGARAGVAVLAVEDDVVAAAERLTGFDEVRAGGALVGRRRGRQQGGESEKGAGQNELDQGLLHVVTSLKTMPSGRTVGVRIRAPAGRAKPIPIGATSG